MINFKITLKCFLKANKMLHLITSENLEETIRLWQLNDKIINYYKTILQISINIKKIPTKHFEYLKTMKYYNDILSDDILEFVKNSDSWQAVKIK